MRFSARVEGLFWGYPRMPLAGSSPLQWARWSHYKWAVHQQNGEPPSPERFVFDLTPALEHFKIEWPVSIWIEPMRYVGSTGRMNSRGFYKNLADSTTLIEPLHRLILADCCDAQHASVLAWHELCHAAQTEAQHARGLPLSAHDRLYQAAFPAKGVGWRRYCSNRYEREAYEAMDNHYSVSRLTWNQ